MFDFDFYCFLHNSMCSYVALKPSLRNCSVNSDENERKESRLLTSITHLLQNSGICSFTTVTVY